ncbi:MAG: 4Fe-4S dicluster domain-containing protein [Firmicutes bacterium]|jgi:formate dehydrogenase subunit beta|nr:4Fe-4S dicluster domain-containing protein [Bacillota bacterium]MDH7494495.1 4Fe-4S dicluster domain-containing protein [Bacillota bacterium]
MKNLLIAVEQEGREKALSSFLARLLETGAVDAMVVLAEVAPGVTTHVLAKDPRFVERWARPLSPVMPSNASQVVSEVVRKRPSGRVGAVLRPCESRALVELIKVRQAAPENVVSICVDCTGTYDPVAYRDAHGSVEGLALREACRVCLNPTPLEDALPGIVLGFIGLDERDGVLVSVHDRLDPDVAAVVDELGLACGEDAGRKRSEAVRGLVQERQSAYDAFLAAREVSGIEAFARELGACTGCHNCRVACPVCYCRECIFDTDTFEGELGQFVRRAERKGALKVPSETILYHLTRMNHMSLSCVACGQCEQACPARLPLFHLFAMASRRTQALFGYVPGRSLEEELPFTTFREDELEPR